MTITRFTPFSDVAVLQNRLNSIFHDFNRPQGTTEGGESLSAGSFVPAVDIYEDAQKLALTFEVPGIRPEDVDVRVENNVLTVKGERSFATDAKEENFRRIERRFGSFVRSFTLPQSVDTEQVNARAEHGVLVIELPKKAAAQPKQIKVAVGAATQPKQVEAQVPQAAAAADEKKAA
ncbi:molecular chaperone (small heat shock protein) [Terriglobus roseus DSM 18391]|uniref:Molecular chaperone (Small heat shock protein) n=1 Tax=Terriglobus roseus (strain DSM 18391 / NRRL B-41598 / KBS 63) TaxID=926566 RepID=I3ZM75_TERRK|nr:Hsp20/alpha crystallin family protein [Terriglobus roseus]AFL90343.1 molecular chaperone (small heat shock protein) [Terriglobus roseus DSM 18391]